LKPPNRALTLRQALYDQAADLQKEGRGHRNRHVCAANVELQNEKQRLIEAEK